MRAGLAGLALLVSTAAMADEVPGEVSLAGGDEVAALCDELQGGGDGAIRAADGLYVMKLPAKAFAFLPYDGHRARLAIDGARGFRDHDGGYELVLHDLLSGTRPASGLELAVPVSSSEAAALVKGHKAGTISLTLWFRVAQAEGDAPVCAATHTADAEGMRLAIDPLAFELAQGSERVASGETPELAALREQAQAQREPRVVLSPPLRTKGGKAADGVARAAAALESGVLACYRDGLAKDDGLRGSLVVGLALSADGRVSETRAELDGLGDKGVVDCVLAQVKGARFPKGQADRFSLPIKFSRGE